MINEHKILWHIIYSRILDKYERTPSTHSDMNDFHKHNADEGNQTRKNAF